MMDRPRSSYGAVYVPPHHRLRSVITTPNYTSSVAAATVGFRPGAGAADIVNSKLHEPPQTAVISPRQTQSLLATRTAPQQDFALQFATASAALRWFHLRRRLWSRARFLSSTPRFEKGWFEFCGFDVCMEGLIFHVMFWVC